MSDRCVECGGTFEKGEERRDEDEGPFHVSCLAEWAERNAYFNEIHG